MIREGEREELEAFFANPGFEEHALADVFARKGSYADLPDDRWMEVVHFAFSNPSLEKEPGLERFDDGWGHYSQSRRGAFLKIVKASVRDSS